MTRAEFDVWSQLYRDAFGPWTARLTDEMRKATPVEVGEAVARAATAAADVGLDAWRKRRA